MAQQTIDIGTVANDGTGDPIRDAFDKCNDNFTELYGALAGLLDFQGATDCSANPNYPAASQGDIYIVSVAGKIGGASGKVVAVGDFYLDIADNAGGTEAGVGTSWAVLEANIAYVPVNKAGDTMTGALVLPANPYDATTWNGSLKAATEDAVRDKIESLSGGSFTAASTTEVLTGTDSAKGGTPDSIAALWEQGSDVASAGTISFGEGGYFNITGTTTITDIDFGTDKAGRKVWVKFAGILTLTHHATTLILPTGANITTAAGDTACFVSEGSDNVRCVSYQRASGSALVDATGGSTAWALAGTGQTATGVYDQAVDGTKATVDFVGLGSFNEILIVARGLTLSSSGSRVIQASVDNGSSWFTSSGDYQSVDNSGVATNTTAIVPHSTSTTAARSFFVHIINTKGPAKAIVNYNASYVQTLFVASASDLNALRFLGTAGNINGGTIRVYAR